MGVTVERYRDTVAFSAAAEPFLVQHEAENNLPLGILVGLAGGASWLTNANGYLAIGRSGREIEGVALWTAGRRLVLSFPDVPAFGEAVGADLQRVGLDVPDVLGPSAAAAAFAGTWEKDGVHVEPGVPQLIYRLTRVSPPMTVPGRLRRAELADRDLLVRWWIGFVEDADAHRPPGEAVEATIDARLASFPPSFYIWDDGGPVSMASAPGPTPHGIRIGGVYTPPERRRRGYASACVAALSQRMLDEGRDFCFLFTDARNATSNSIYQRIGYELVTAVSELRFEGAVAR